MKKLKLYHSRVFNEQDLADGYYKRNISNIKRVGKRLAKLLKNSGFTEGAILDVGCGFASVAIEIAKAFPKAKIVGCDLSKPLLMIGETLIKNEGLEKQITLINGDAQKIDFDTDNFDVVINSFLLHIVENKTAMLNEIERVAKPNAKILITDLRRGFLANFIKKLKTAYSTNEAKDIINNSNIRKGNFSNGPFWWDYITN